MERLDATIEHFGETCKTGNLTRRDSVVPQQLAGAAGGNDLDAELVEFPCKFYQAGFIGNGNKCAGDFHFGNRKSIYEYSSDHAAPFGRRCTSTEAAM